MAYKDEYEVARLHRPGLPGRTGPVPHGYSVRYNLASPLLADKGEDRAPAEAIRQWMFKAFQRMAGLKHLRGGWTSSARPKSGAWSGR